MYFGNFYASPLFWIAILVRSEGHILIVTQLFLGGGITF
jgi:hypothetical protein